MGKLAYLYLFGGVLFSLLFITTVNGEGVVGQNIQNPEGTNIGSQNIFAQEADANFQWWWLLPLLLIPVILMLPGDELVSTQRDYRQRGLVLQGVKGGKRGGIKHFKKRDKNPSQKILQVKKIN